MLQGERNKPELSAGLRENEKTSARWRKPTNEAAECSPHEDEEQQQRGHEAAAVGRRQEAEHSEAQREAGHREDLETRADEHREEAAPGRSAEHLAAQAGSKEVRKEAPSIVRRHCKDSGQRQAETDGSDNGDAPVDELP